MRIIEPKKCRTFSDAGKIVSNIESDLCFYYHCLNSEGWHLPHNSFTHSVYWEGVNRVWERVPDYQLLWNNTKAWSAGHCSKLEWIMIREKTCDVRSCIKEGIISRIMDSFGFQKTRLHSKTWTHQFIPWV